jgi:hypothetical protein
VPMLAGERAHRADGLIAIAVPAGRSNIDIRYAQTADETLGDAISIAALGVLAWLAVWGRTRNSVTAEQIQAAP